MDREIEILQKNATDTFNNKGSMISEDFVELNKDMNGLTTASLLSMREYAREMSIADRKKLLYELIEETRDAMDKDATGDEILYSANDFIHDLESHIEKLPTPKPVQGEKIIMYDSPEAAKEITLTGWLSADGRFWGKDEHMARWGGCTHLTCECGNIMTKSWTKCESCRHKSAVERYNKLPFEEWDGVKPVVTWDGDEYFFDIETLNDYMSDNEMEEIDLLICDPIGYSTIDTETIAPDCHEDWDAPNEMIEKIKSFNDYLKSLPPHSYEPGKIRTNYKLPKE